ncbi:MAG: hypothetical protein D6798_19440 [Deltaproteobacteria bacterium]|nr:MAG: hypothetical protein D6798_19440 [Deltaproteobacteria bacterium]
MSTALSPYSSRYTAERALFSFLGPAFRIRGPEGNLRFFVKQKAFRLKEEINVWADEAQTTRVLAIKARGIADFSGTYDVVDAATGERVGSLKREGFKSLLRDEWVLLDADGKPFGRIREDSTALALLRRFLPIIPQTFHVTVGDREVGTIQQRFHLFRLRYDVDLSGADGETLDPRLGVAAVVLLLAIEGRQGDR